MLPVSLDCIFLIATSVFFDVFTFAGVLYSLLCYNVTGIPLRCVDHGNDVDSKEPVRANADVSR